VLHFLCVGVCLKGWFCYTYNGCRAFDWYFKFCFSGAMFRRAYDLFFRSCLSVSWDVYYPWFQASGLLTAVIWCLHCDVLLFLVEFYVISFLQTSVSRMFSPLIFLHFHNFSDFTFSHCLTHLLISFHL